MKRTTYAGAARHLERAVTVAFYRTAERFGIPRPNARHGVERADRWLQVFGVGWLIATAIVVLVALLQR